MADGSVLEQRLQVSFDRMIFSGRVTLWICDLNVCADEEGYCRSGDWCTPDTHVDAQEIRMREIKLEKESAEGVEAKFAIRQEERRLAIKGRSTAAYIWSRRRWLKRVQRK
jgi:hypothetical protein